MAQKIVQKAKNPPSKMYRPKPTEAKNDSRKQS
jgi:hypothetical protein